VGPASLKVRIFMDLQLDFTTDEIKVLMGKFDPDDSGSINLCECNCGLICI
jgi:hypothetical protein